MKAPKFDYSKFRPIISAHGYSELNKGLNSYAKSPWIIDDLVKMIEVFPEYKENAREMAIMLFDGQRNGNSNSEIVISSLYYVKSKYESNECKNFRLKLDNIPFHKSLYKRTFKLAKLDFTKALSVIKSRLSVVSPNTIEKYRKVMTAIDASR